MKIVFVQPPYRSHVINPPLGIGYMCSYLREAGFEASFIDLNLYKDGLERVESLLRAVNADVVGISIMCTGVDFVRQLTRKIKSAFELPIVVGGPQVSALPEHSLKFTGADFAVIGEGEATVVELMRSLEGAQEYGSIAGLAFLVDGVFTLNERRPLIEDLDSLPFPAWDLIRPDRYNIAPVLSSAKAFPIAPMITSRGCPYNCTFCAGKVVWGRTYRYRGAVSVVDEMELLMKDYGVKEIFLSDDNFNLKRSHAESVCREIIRRGLKIHWACPNGLRADLLSPDLLRLMKEAGCHLIGLGIESGSQHVLDLAKKDLDLSKLPSVCRMIDDAGIKAVGFFVLGLPGDTVQTINQTIDVARSLPLVRAWFNILAPYPGSEIFEQYAKDVDIDRVDWSCLDTTGGEVAQMSSVPPAELFKLQRRAVRSFYLRPRILLDLLVSQRPATIAALMRSKFFKEVIDANKKDETR